MAETNTILTPNELEELFYDFTVLILGANADVRRSWPTSGAPAFGVADDVTFFKIYDVPSSMTEQREDEYSQIVSPAASNMATTYTRTLQVNWTCYGPSSWNNATLIRNGLFYQENHDVLAVQNIYVVPDMQPPKRVPDLFQGLWYQRYDLIVNFNEKVVVNREVPYIEVARIVVEDHSGVVATVEIEE